jgi:adenosylmethionine-8-amino-7-oxononanoate aminotransferase
VLMPPLSVSVDELSRMVSIVSRSIATVTQHE